MMICAGTSLATYFILGKTGFSSGVVVGTALDFFLDDQLVRTVDFTPTASDFLYNQSLYNTTNLENKEHTIRIQTKGKDSLIMFDYLTYT